jgi:hypothetical protein
LRRDFLVKHVIEGWVEGKIEVTEDEARRCKQLLGDLMEMGRYCRFKEEILYHTLWRTCFGRGNGPIISLQNE